VTGATTQRRLLAGWGATAPTAADVLAPTTLDDVVKAVGDPPKRGVLPRGLGRSYGDAAQNAGGLVVDLTGCARVRRFDVTAGVVEVEAGLSLHTLMRQVLPFGWFVPVTPGTRYVTVGGAIAADIHGKNHHVEGSFTQHVRGLDLLLASGEVRTVTPTEDADVFWATAGGMGLTGIVLAATIQLLPVETSLMSVDTERAPNLDALIERLAATDDQYRYSVAWIDLLARGAKMGRSVITRGDHARLDELPVKRRNDPLAFSPHPLASMPAGIIPPGLLNRATVAAFNEVWYRKAPVDKRGESQSIAAFFHPLDLVDRWNRIYGRPGLVQYQFAVPYGAEDVVRTAVDRLSAAGSPAFLAVLKRFGAGSPGPLSFPAPGWTLALDLPTSMNGLARLLDGLDELVVDAGGRIYLAKDSRLRPELLPAMYPRLDEWRAVRSRLDPGGIFASDLSRRLHL
jgi:decaprenylphospho-beta-D-ribofuranose 2-oxidase